MTPEQWNQFINDYGPVMWTIVFVVVAGGIIVKSWPFISGVVHVVEIIQELPDRLDRIEERIELVEREVTLNSGSSLKDAVKRIEIKLDTGKIDTPD